MPLPSSVFPPAWVWRRRVVSCRPRLLVRWCVCWFLCFLLFILWAVVGSATRSVAEFSNRDDMSRAVRELDDTYFADRRIRVDYVSAILYSIARVACRDVVPAFAEVFTRIQRSLFHVHVYMNGTSLFTIKCWCVPRCGLSKKPGFLPPSMACPRLFRS